MFFPLQATLRYKESLDPEAAEVADVESLIRRWVSFYSALILL